MGWRRNSPTRPAAPADALPRDLADIEKKPVAKATYAALSPAPAASRSRRKRPSKSTARIPSNTYAEGSDQATGCSQWQDIDRIVDAAKRGQREHRDPRQALCAQPEPKDQRRYDQSDAPAEQQQVGEEGGERQSQREHRNAEQRWRENTAKHADHRPDQTHDRQRDDQLVRAHRATKSELRLRAHISSIKLTETPRFERKRISQSTTALISTPAACATQELCCIKNKVTNPQRIICTVGQ